MFSIKQGKAAGYNPSGGLGRRCGVPGETPELQAVPGRSGGEAAGGERLADLPLPGGCSALYRLTCGALPLDGGAIAPRFNRPTTAHCVALGNRMPTQ